MRLLCLATGPRTCWGNVLNAEALADVVNTPHFWAPSQAPDEPPQGCGRGAWEPIDPVAVANAKGSRAHSCIEITACAASFVRLA